MKLTTLLTTLLFALAFNACSVNNFAYLEENNRHVDVITKIDEKAHAEEKIFQWKISNGDRVEINAFNQSSTSTNGQLTQLLGSGGQKYFTNRYGDEGMLIKADGIVRLPLIGAVKISGLTEDEAAKVLIEKYKKYLKHPFVTVKILNQKLFVLGEVRQPGVVLVTNGTMSLFEALAHSGDLTDYANRTNIRILRGDMRDPEVREVNLNNFRAVQFASLTLRPNDIVYVEPRESRSGMVGASEEIPFWSLIGNMLAPFTGSAIIYGVTK